MRLAIHHRKGSYSERWIDYCESNLIEYRLVNAFDSDIINQLNGYDAFMWHHHHGKYEDVLAARSILFALEHAGVKVFPNFNTGWHFDNKVAQKYLLEAIEAPLVPSYVFYTKSKAIEWANQTSYPKVFKLKGGAGSANVKLVKTKSECIKLIEKSFGKGFKQFDGFEYFLDTLTKYKAGLKNISDVIKAIGRFFISTQFSKTMGNEKGYVYFQDFMNNNDSDLRVIIVDDKAFAIKRMVRENDFRASGSGIILYEKNQIDERCVKIAFEVNRKLESQSIAFDFVFDDKDNPRIVEISYGYAIEAYDYCTGYWDSYLNWHEAHFNPQEWMIKAILRN